MPFSRRTLLSAASCALALGAFLAIVGARWQFVQAHGSDVPFNDHWDGEGMLFLRPFWAGESIWPGLWIPHNEHRIVGTRLLALGLAALDGMWNARGQMLVNAGLAAAGLLLWPWVLRRSLPPWGLLLCAGAAVALGTLPFSWDNTLWGFQSQFHLLLLFGGLHLAATWREDRTGPAWWFGLGAGLAAIFTVASGFGSAAACVAVAAWRLRRPDDGAARRFLWTTLTTNAALVATGVLLRHVVPYHADFQAGSLAVWGDALLRLIAWPFGQAPLGLVVQAPLLIAGYAVLVRRKPAPGDAVLLAGAAWCAFQAAAIAWGRGGDPSGFAPRYRDIHLVGLVLNVLCLVRLWAAAPDRRGAWWRGAVAAGWLTVVGVGLSADLSGIRYWRAIERREAAQDAQVQAMRAFLSTGERGWLDRTPEVRALSGTVDNVVTMLIDPGVRAHLPPSIRLPLPCGPDSAHSRGVASFAPPTEAEQPYRAAAWRLTPTPTEPAVFTSQPLPASLRPVMRLRIRGRLGPGAATLQLIAPNGATTTPLTAAVDSGDRWKTVNLLYPPAGGRLVVEVPAGAAPFEFTTPFDLGLVTYYSEKLLRAGAGVAQAGLLLFLAGAVGLVWSARAGWGPPVAAGAHPEAGEPLVITAMQLRRFGAGAGLALILGLFAWPAPHLRFQAQRDDAYLESGRWGALPVDSFSATLHPAGGGPPGETCGRVAELRPSLAEHFFGTFTSQGDEFVGTLQSAPFRADQRFLSLLVAGHPDACAVQLDELDADGGVRRTIDFAGPAIEYPLHFWSVDTGAAGTQWRVRIDDRSAGAFGWAAVSRPLVSADPTTARRLTQAFRAEWSVTARRWHLFAAAAATAIAGAAVWRNKRTDAEVRFARCVGPATAVAFALWLFAGGWPAAVLFGLAVTGALGLLGQTWRQADRGPAPARSWRLL